VLKRFALTVLAATVAVSQVHAGSLSAVDGTAMINRGDGFKPLEAGAEIRPGDKVLMPKDGAGKVTFRDGCTVQLQPGQMLSMSATSPCAGGSNVAQLNLRGRMGQSTTNNDDNNGAIFWILGGAGVVGGAIAIIASQSDNDKKPASP